MERQDDKKDIARLERINAQLNTSLERCRELLSECRSKLAANSNEERGDDEAGTARSRTS